MRAGMVAFGLPFAPFDLFEAISRWLPGGVVTTGIDAMVAIITGLGIGPTSVAAKAAEKAMAVVMFVVASAVLGGLLALALRRVRARILIPAVGGALFALVLASEVAMHTATVVGSAWNAGVLFGWSFLLAKSIEQTEATAEETTAARSARRHDLVRLLAGLTVGAGSLLGLSFFVRRGKPGERAGEKGVTTPMPGHPAPVPGTRAELTSNDRFYRVDINLEPPRIDASTWRLRVQGLVEQPLELTLDQIRALPAVTQTITLECISNPLGGDLISTSRWTGVPLREVLRLARSSDRARAIQIDAADGFYESLSTAEADDPRVLLVYAMNGVALPAEHGFPLRIYIPNRHGMKQPKWITRLQAIDREGRGYWPERGWSQEAIVKTTSVIDVVDASSVGGDRLRRRTRNQQGRGAGRRRTMGGGDNPRAAIGTPHVGPLAVRLGPSNREPHVPRAGLRRDRRSPADDAAATASRRCVGDPLGDQARLGELARPRPLRSSAS